MGFCEREKKSEVRLKSEPSHPWVRYVALRWVRYKGPDDLHSTNNNLVTVAQLHQNAWAKFSVAFSLHAPVYIAFPISVPWHSMSLVLRGQRSTVVLLIICTCTLVSRGTVHKAIRQYWTDNFWLLYISGWIHWTWKLGVAHDCSEIFRKGVIWGLSVDMLQSVIYSGN